jgi:hypothetical protein
MNSNSNNITTGSIYDVSTYSDQDLYNILDLNNPSDRELEAKILAMVNKYTRMKGTLSADMLAQFFIDIYARFFEMPEQESEYDTDYDTDNEETDEVEYDQTRREGFQVEYGDTMNLKNESVNIPSDPGVDVSQSANRKYNPRNGNSWSNYAISDKYNTLPNEIQRGTQYDQGNVITRNYQFTNLNGNVQSKDPQITQTYNNAQINRVGTLDTTKNGRGENSTQLTKPIDYTNDYINPLLKQTIKRVISIDSQYRDNKQSASTEFTFNLSEPLKDVVSLKLYSVQIPYTWYTINSSFGGNFFYIKGDADGIDNGTHDYKIEIPSGNYTASTLVEKIQNTIAELRGFAPQVDFGNTSISYNASTVQTTLNIDIKEAFGESNYYLEFPNWSSPIDGPTRTNTLAGYMGFNTTKYDCFSIYSGRTIQTSQTQPDAAKVITIDASNSTITIVNYIPENIGDDYDASFAFVQKHDSTGSITLTPATYNIYTLLAEINAKFTAHSSYDYEYTKIQSVDIDISSNAQNAGYSYLKLDLKFKRESIQNKETLKTVVIFPKDTNDTWNTLLGFGEIIYETSHIKSETTVPQTTYVVPNDVTSGSSGLKFTCDVSGYIDTTNNILIDLSASTKVGYTLDEYIDEINRAITSYVDVNSNKSIAGTKIEITPNNYLKFTPNVQLTFTNKDYTIEFEGRNIPQILCGEPNTNNQYIFNLKDKNVWSRRFDITSGNPKIDRTDKIRITPKFPYSGNSYVPQSFIINLYTKDGLSQTIISVRELESYINQQISNYRDNENKNPFKDGLTRLTRIDDYSYTFTVGIYKSFTTENYTLSLYGRVLNGIDPGYINPWKKYLKFEGTDNSGNVPYEEIYNFRKNAKTLYGVGSTGIVNKAVILNNLMTLNTTNNYFYIKSYNIDGLTKNGVGVYDIKITIPVSTTGTITKKYAVEDIYDIINNLLDTSFNGIAKGSTIGKDANGYTTFQMNINKVFRTPDYRLVFYDPYSFVTCYTGATRRGAQSVQNATWDTTVGWVLGFREQIIYYLKEYPNANTTPGGNPVCTLIGDTTVSTSLYNYFLIVLDDYTQNHLNDGLVTITPQETAIDVGPYKYVCDPYATSGGGALIAVPANVTDYKSISQRELYTFNQKIQSKKVKDKSYSKGPFVKDIFGIIPIKTSGLIPGATYVEFGGTLQNQERMYFGPVNIHRMTIRLLNDRGDLVDLNNANWSFSLVCEQLYKKTTL